ncbi:MAG: putative zinc metalloprotease Rip3 [Anaerolineae bacterium]|nr:putative zinc metalloprotease Rip3 [Anaerolineae bacterium]
MRNNIRLGKLFGIEVGLDYSWFIIFLLIVWSLAGHYLILRQSWSFAFRLGLALVTAVLFFASILAHEFGHSLVAIAKGVPVQRITLFIFGGIAQITREPKQALDEFLIAIAGPAVSLALAGGFGLVWLVGRQLDLRGLAELGSWLGLINLSLAIFNLIPGFPLDGGRVLRAIVWGVTGNMLRATRLVAIIGQGVAWLFIAAGIWQVFAGSWANGLWIAFIGWFLNNVAASSGQQAAWQELLQGHTAAEVMMTDCPRLPPDMSLAQLVNGAILSSGRRCFPVVDGERMVGLVTVHQVKDVPREVWPTTAVGQVMIPAAQLRSARPGEKLSVVLERMTNKGINQLPVMENGRLVGIVARNNILNAIRTLSELTSAP